jgi:hypothetical protein
VATRFDQLRVILRLPEHTKAKLQLPVSLDYFTDHFAWQLAAQPLPLFLFAVSRGQRVLFQCISVSMNFDSLYLSKAVEGYTPTITCCNGTSWIKMGFSVDPPASVSLRVFHVSTEMKQSFIDAQTELGTVSFFRIRVGLAFSASVVQKDNFVTTLPFRLFNAE